MWLLRLGSALLVLAIVIASGVQAASPITNATKFYDGYKVYRIETKGQDVAMIEALQSLKYDEWNHDLTSIDINVSPDQQTAFEQLGLRSKVLHQDLGVSIQIESSVKTSSKWKRYTNDSTDNISYFTEYKSYPDHQDYFQNLQASLPNNSMMMTSGKLTDGRDIYGLHVWGSKGPGVMPAIIYHGTEHAREWISAPVVEYLARQLVNSSLEAEPEIIQILNKYDFYFFPIVNPDELIYSQITDRMWRKNRQSAPAIVGGLAVNAECIGIDINRNWPFKWNQNPLGASTSPCAETYQGQNASEASEIQGLDNFIREVSERQGIQLYVDYHAYGQMILYPYGYNKTIYPPELGMWTSVRNDLI